jgi:hypothetical protein
MGLREKYKWWLEAVQVCLQDSSESLTQYVTQSSSSAEARKVQGCYCGKFKHSNKGSTGGRNFGKFKCTKEAVYKTRPRYTTPSSSVTLA